MFVVRVTSTKEQMVKKLLDDKGYKILCPRKLKYHSKNGRERVFERVLFVGYLFLDIGRISDRDFYAIKNTMHVKGLLSSKYKLRESEVKYIRLLNNDDKPIDKIDIRFGMDNKAVVLNHDLEDLSTANISRVNRKDRTISFKFKIEDEIKKITVNYNLI